MAFIVAATSKLGAVTFSKSTAREALEKWMELEQAGLQKITAKDDAGRSLSKDQLAMLY